MGSRPAARILAVLAVLTVGGAIVGGTRLAAGSRPAARSGPVVEVRDTNAGQPAHATTTPVPGKAGLGSTQGSVAVDPPTSPSGGSPGGPKTKLRDYGAYCDVPGFECVTAAKARGWFPEAFLDGPGVEHIASSASGGTTADPYDSRQRSGLTMVVGARTAKADAVGIEELLADHAVMLSARVVGVGEVRARQAEGSERAVTVRGYAAILLSVRSSPDKPGIRTVEWMTTGPRNVQILWQAVDFPAHRSDERLIALLNGLSAR